MAEAAGLRVEAIEGDHRRTALRAGRGAGRPPGALGIVGRVSGSSDQIRLLLVEDVPQVAQYVRGLLNAQSHIKLLDVVSDGRKVPEFVREGHPDIVMIDALLQGKVRGLKLAASLRQEGLATPIIIVTVPQNPIARDPGKGIDAVLSMPFSGFELINLLQSIMAQAQAERPEGRSRVYSVFAPKGGVGKTTIAFNLAVALAPDRRRRGPRSSTAASSSATCARCCACRPTRPRSSSCRPTASRRATSPTSSGATRRASTSCSRRRASRCTRCSASATWTRS